MSQVKKHLKLGITLLMAALFALNCSRSSKTQFAQNMENDANKAAPTYEEWVALVGQQKTDALYAGIGQDALNLLSSGYGIGLSNMAQLINGITDANKLIALIGNDAIVGTGPGNRTGLGVPVTLYMLLRIDAEMTTNLSANIPAAAIAPPTDQDTVANLISIVNTLTTTEISTKLVDMMGQAGGNGFDLSRSLNAAGPGGTTAANQLLYVQRMAKIVAHVTPGATACTAKLCPLLQNLAAADVTGKVAPLIKGVTSADKLVETIETTTNINNMVGLLSTAPFAPATIPGVTAANVTGKLVPIINQVTDCTKMGYMVNNITSLDTLIRMIDNVIIPANLGNLLNLAEGGSTWASQVSPAENWGIGPAGQLSKGAPFSTAAAGGSITANIAGGAATSITVVSGGTNYLPGLSLTFPGCTTQPSINLNVQGGVIQTTGHYIIAGAAGVGCTNGAAQPATIVPPVAGNRTLMERLVATINGLIDTAEDPDTVADFWKLLTLVDSLSPPNGMTKMVRLLQDVEVASDVYDLVNNMTGLAGTGGCVNGEQPVVLGGPGAGGVARAFVVNNRVAYVAVTTAGAGYTTASTATVAGCTGLTLAITLNAGAIQQISANSPLNTMAQVLDLMTLANLPRLSLVMDGQRAYDNQNVAQQTNAALTTTYLGKLRVLMSNLSQPQEGPLKVGDLLNGVTNPDKIIDLIWGVTTTTNLSTVINGIFKASEVPGCSDGSAGTFIGPSTTTASDTGTCEQSGNGFFYGERDTAVTTLVYLVENVASAQKLIDMIELITPANVVALVNHIATYSQHADGTPHVYPRGGAGLDPQAAGKRLAKIVDNTTTIAQLIFVTNNVSSMIRMSKLVAFMDIGVSATTGTGKMAVLINAIGGTNCYLSTTVVGRGNTTAVAPGGSAACAAQASQHATGMGKMVNVVDFISGATTSAAMVQLKNLLNDVTDINKTADLINQTVKSSNIVGLLNGVTDPRYGTSTTDLVNMLNSLPRGEISKLVSLVGEIGDATGSATVTFPGDDHVLIAQLMAPYVTTTGGLGQVRMNELMGSLAMSGGQNYTSTPAIGGLNAGGGTGATATAIVPAGFVPAAAGAITRITMTSEGICATGTVTVTGVAGGGTGASFSTITAPIAGSASFKVKGVYINSGGSGYTAQANALTFTGCATAPVAASQVNGVVGISVTAGGTGYTDSFSTVTVTGGGGAGATATALVAGPINTLTSFFGGSGYTNGQVCPVRGAGGSGGTCTVTVAGGQVTGCSAYGAGTDYIDGQIVSIGGAATFRATSIVAGSLNTITPEFSGCGYAVAPSVTVLTGANECATAGTYTAVLTAGRVTSVTTTTAATGCPANPTIVVGAQAHGDGATAIVNNVTGGRVVAISLSSPADSLAQLLTNTEKAPRLAAITYNAVAPNVSAREAMVRMLHHGVDHASAGYASSPMPYPGIGPVHIATNVLSNLSSAGSVMSVINLMNSDTTSLTDLVVMIGCGDHVEYGPTAATDFESRCSSHSPSLW